MNIFSLVSFSALAATLLVGCEPKKDVVTPQPVKSNQNARLGSLSMNTPHNYTNGYTPAIAINYYMKNGHKANYAVEVHKWRSSDYIGFRVSDLSLDQSLPTKDVASNNGRIVDQRPRPQQNGSKYSALTNVDPDIFLKGKDPAVALSNSNQFVLICEDTYGRLTYTRGKIDMADLTPTIKINEAKSMIQSQGQWGAAEGHKPSIAFLPGDKLLVVYEYNQNNDYGLYYTIGTLEDSDKITWTESKLYDHGQDPSISVNEKGQLVEAHKSQYAYELWFRPGQFRGSSIAWTAWASMYMTGEQPCITIDYNGNIAEMHKSELENRIYLTEGSLNNNQFSVEYITKLDPLANAANPGIAVARNNAHGDGTYDFVLHTVYFNANDKDPKLWNFYSTYK